MKFLVVFALILATASASFLHPSANAVHPRDLVVPAEIEGRITNGKDAAEGQFPYQVGLQFTNPSGSGWWCGGSLIGNGNDASYVLTAAHCTSGASSVKVNIGATIRTSPKLTQTIASSNFIQHKSYNSIILLNDISLIKLNSVISNTPGVGTIALPKESSSYSDYVQNNVIISGWGLTSDKETAVASKLQYAVLKVISNTDCAKTYGSLTITSKNICADTPNGTSTCSGDSGGPMVDEKSNTQIGVTSFVHSNGCQSGAPAGFVRVTSFLPWIKESTGLKL